MDERNTLAARYCEMAAASFRNGRLAEAEQQYRAAIAASPRYAPALMGLAALCLNLARTDEAVFLYQTALAGDPGHAQALAGLGDALSAGGRQGDAEQVFRRLLAQDRNSAAGNFGLGTVLKQTGRFREAREAFGRAVALAPNVPAYHLALAEAGPFVENDARLPALERLTAAPAGLSPIQQAEAHFALAKALDDLKRYGAAFEHLRRGNALNRALIAYAEGPVLALMQETMTAFTPGLIAAKSGAGFPSQLPVFIVGMPRSGTTLVEQILASHPEVFGGGELTCLPDLILGGFAGADYPADAASLSAQALRQLGGAYAVRLGALAPSAKRVTDKLPANFNHLGLIHLALPNAKIIHVRRDPMDTCFSCYSKLFASGLNYAYDLVELGRYYKAYGELMAHWRAALPAGAMLEVQYENLVSDFEAHARQLVEFCGLGWDERCLKFHENKRAVRTMSEYQVRKPVFQSSIGRWRPYEKWLSPLLEALR